MKSQAKGLAKKGKDVTYICLEGSIGGPEAIMSLANKQEMSKFSTVTTLSIQDLATYYNNSHKWLPFPSPLNLLKFYIEKEKPSHVFVDEAPLETSWSKYLVRLPLFWVYNLGKGAKNQNGNLRWHLP